MSKNAAETERAFGTTEELLAKAQAETAASSQQPAPEQLNIETQAPDTTLQQEQEQQAREYRERMEQEQREWEARRDGQDEASPNWRAAPQNEGINTHPTPDASPVSPGKQQHQQALAAAAKGQNSGEKEIITKTQLGVLVTLDGIYVVPKYKSVTRDKPAEPSLSERFAKDQSSGRPQEKGQEKANDKENTKTQAQGKGKDRDRGMER